MTVIIAGVSPSVAPSEVRVVLDALGGGSSITATYPGTVVEPSDAAARCFIDGEQMGGQWWPVAVARSSGGGEMPRTVVRWGKDRRPWGVETYLTDLDYLRGQLAGMGDWIAYMGDAAALASALEPPGPGVDALAELLLTDMPAPPAKIADYAKTLREYQIAIDPKSAVPALLLLDMSGADAFRVPDRVSSWERETSYTDAASARIECRYQTREGGIDTIGDGSGSPTLHVENPAGSRAEAWLEISLQRLSLLMESERASMTTPLDASLYPGDGIEYDDTLWIAARVEHRIAGDRISQTSVTLRPSPPLPGALPEDLRVRPQNDLASPP